MKVTATRKNTAAAMWLVVAGSSMASSTASRPKRVVN